MISCKKSLTEALNRNESRTDLLKKRTRDLCVGHQRTGKHSSIAFSCFSLYSCKYMKKKCGEKKKNTFTFIAYLCFFCPHNPLVVIKTKYYNPHLTNDKTSEQRSDMLTILSISNGRILPVESTNYAVTLKPRGLLTLSINNQVQDPPALEVLQVLFPPTSPK